MWGTRSAIIKSRLWWRQSSRSGDLPYRARVPGGSRYKCDSWPHGIRSWQDALVASLLFRVRVLRPLRDVLAQFLLSLVQTPLGIWYKGYFGENGHVQTYAHTLTQTLSVSHLHWTANTFEWPSTFISGSHLDFARGLFWTSCMPLSQYCVLPQCSGNDSGRITDGRARLSEFRFGLRLSLHSEFSADPNSKWFDLKFVIYFIVQLIHQMRSHL